MAQGLMLYVCVVLICAVNAYAYIIPPPSSRSPGSPVCSRKLQRKLVNLDMDMEGWTPPSSPSDYVFIPPEVTADIYVGSIVALVPIVWATYEFASRIKTQQDCLVCAGSGLVYLTKQVTSLLHTAPLTAHCSLLSPRCSMLLSPHSSLLTAPLLTPHSSLLTPHSSLLTPLTHSSLLPTTKQGNPISRPRKCYSCGGFLPWLGWKMFFLSTLAPGNGGALQRPAGDYEATNERIRQERQEVQDQDS
jgi:hypothetical protein